MLPAVTIANVYRDRKKRHHAFEPKDFLVRPSIEDVTHQLIEASERDPARALPGRTAARPGGKTPGQMLTFLEGMFLAREGAKDNRRRRPVYEE